MTSGESSLLENGERNNYSTCSSEKQNLIENGKHEGKEGETKSKWTRNQIITATTLLAMTMCQGICFSIIAPFFPSEAARKGASPTVVGLVFGVYQLVIVITSPFYGYLMIKIDPMVYTQYLMNGLTFGMTAQMGKMGGKLMCCLGGAILGVCSILFGFVDKLPDGPVYIAMCFICRIVEGNGAAMIWTSSFALLASSFPRDIGAVVGLNETVIGVGFLIGPAVGGALYSAGGYPLPFVVVGGVMLVTVIVACFTLHKQEQVQQLSGGMLTLLKVPGCLVVYVTIIISGISISYLDPTFNPFVEKTFPWVTIVEIGLIFTILPATYAICGPINGYISDKGVEGTLCLAGLAIDAIGYLLLGPNPWLATFIPTTIPETAIALILIGIGASCVIIPLFSILNKLIRNEGFPEGMQTLGLVSGFFTSAFSFGSFIGPTAAGSLASVYGFAWSSSICAFLNLAVAILLGTYMGIMRVRGKWPIPLPAEIAELVTDDVTDNSVSSNNLP